MRLFQLRLFAANPAFAEILGFRPRGGGHAPTGDGRHGGYGGGLGSADLGAGRVPDTLFQFQAALVQAGPADAILIGDVRHSRRRAALAEAVAVTKGQIVRSAASTR